MYCIPSANAIYDKTCIYLAGCTLATHAASPFPLGYVVAYRVYRTERKEN